MYLTNPDIVGFVPDAIVERPKPKTVAQKSFHLSSAQQTSDFRGFLLFKTAVISDTHLGRLASNAEFLFEFLSNVKCQKLIIVGDFIDGWDLVSTKCKNFPEMHARCLDAINAMAANGVEVIILRGNHDEKLAKSEYKLMNRTVTFQNKNKTLVSPIHFAKSIVHCDGQNRRHLILHGDVFDNWQKKSWMKNIAGKADSIYEPLLKCSNAFRKAVLNLTGLNISLVAPLKSGTKLMAGVIKNFEQALSKDSIKSRYDGIICGHIHAALIRKDKGFTYMNSGDWVENGKCLVEAEDGNWCVLNWIEERRKLGLGRLASITDVNSFSAYRPITNRQIRIMQNRIWPGKDHKNIFLIKKYKMSKYCQSFPTAEQKSLKRIFVDGLSQSTDGPIPEFNSHAI